jgi:hypothetical protein
MSLGSRTSQVLLRLRRPDRQAEAIRQFGSLPMMRGLGNRRFSKAGPRAVAFPQSRAWSYGDRQCEFAVKPRNSDHMD